MNNVQAITDATFQKDVIEASKQAPVLVDFWASWCMPCKKMEPIVEGLAEELSEIKVAKMNIEENMSVPTSLGIISIPTFAVYKDGELVSSHTGTTSKLGLKKLLGI